MSTFKSLMCERESALASFCVFRHHAERAKCFTFECLFKLLSSRPQPLFRSVWRRKRRRRGNCRRLWSLSLRGESRWNRLSNRPHLLRVSAWVSTVGLCSLTHTTLGLAQYSNLWSGFDLLSTHMTNFLYLSQVFKWLWKPQVCRLFDHQMGHTYISVLKLSLLTHSDFQYYAPKRSVHVRIEISW